MTRFHDVGYSNIKADMLLCFMVVYSERQACNTFSQRMQHHNTQVIAYSIAFCRTAQKVPKMIEQEKQDHCLQGLRAPISKKVLMVISLSLHTLTKLLRELPPSISTFKIYVSALINDAHRWALTIQNVVARG